MLSRSWVVRVGCGSLLAGVCGVVGFGIVMQAVEHSAPPVELSVLEVFREGAARKALTHLRITDLVMHCDTREATEGKIYVSAVRDMQGPVIVVELDPDDDCEDGPVRVAGSVMFPHQTSIFEGDMELVERAMFRPHPGYRGGLVTCAALILLGAALVWSGLRRRRAEQEQRRGAANESPVSAARVQHDGDPYRQGGDGRWLLPGPLRPDEQWSRSTRRRALAAGGLGVMMLATGLLLAMTFTRDAIRMHSVWATGELATRAYIHGRSGGLLNEVKLIVVYSDASGRRYHGTYWRIALLPRIDDETPNFVKYDREDPTSFAVSAMIEGFWGEVALMIGMLGLVVASSLILLRAQRRRLRALAQIREVLHSSPEEVILEVLYAQRQEDKGVLLSTVYGLRLPDGSEHAETLMVPEQPLFLEIDESRVLGLCRAGHPGQVVILRDDLSPLVADLQEAERVRLRYRRGRGERPVT